MKRFIFSVLFLLVGTASSAFDLNRLTFSADEMKVLFPDPQITQGDLRVDEALSKSHNPNYRGKAVEIIVVIDQNDPHFHDVNDVCRPLYTSTVRRVPASVARQVFADYVQRFSNMPNKLTQDLSVRGKGYEIDHFVSLELGGSNCGRQGDVDMSQGNHPCVSGNLWPQPYNPSSSNDIPGARLKDQVEDELKRRVCSGRIDIHEAQGVVMGVNPLTGRMPVIEGVSIGNWYAFFYHQMYKKDQAKYESWANTNAQGIKISGTSDIAPETAPTPEGMN